MYLSRGRSCTKCSKEDDCAFARMADEALEKISEKKRTLTFSRGETIFHIGDAANYFYCINTGRVQIYRSSPYREQSFAILGDGDWLGHRDVLAGGDYRHNARCLTKTTVCKFPASELMENMAANPGFATLIARNLADSWIESEHQSYNLGARKVMERLADFLLSLTGESNGIDAANQEIDMNLTREMLATLMGATTESVIRTLSDFKSRGWIKMDKGKVSLINPKELIRLVDEA